MTQSTWTSVRAMKLTPEIETAAICATVEKDGRIEIERMWLRFDPPLYAYLGPDGRRDLRDERGAWCFPTPDECVFSDAEAFKQKGAKLWELIDASTVLEGLRSLPGVVLGEPEPVGGQALQVCCTGLKDGALLEGRVVYDELNLVLRFQEWVGFAAGPPEVRERTTFEYRYNEPVPEEMLVYPTPGMNIRIADW